MMHLLIQGAARYFRSENAIDEVADLELFGNRPLLVYGQKALHATEGRLMQRLSNGGEQPILWLNKGFCTRAQVTEAAYVAEVNNCDYVLAIGGGKSMDLGKAIAAYLGLRVVTIPTIAATCAAVTPFSVMYDEFGRPDGELFFDSPVDLCVVDMKVIRKAPKRTLHAGIVDSMAKLPELIGNSTLNDSVLFHTAKILAMHVYNTLKIFCKRIYSGNEVDIVDVVDIVIAVTGTCSGYVSGTRQQALAHAFNAAVRKLYPCAANKWLHGETVGVGILIQMYINNDPNLKDMQFILRTLGMPTNISSLGVKIDWIADTMAERVKIDRDSDLYVMLKKSIMEFQ